MIKLKQPEFRSFLTYIFSFIILTLLIYLSIPFFFNYENFKPKIEKKLFFNFGLNLKFTDKIQYNFFPSPRLNIYKVEILNFPEGSNKIGLVKKIILKVPFKKLVNIKKIDFDSVELIDASINVKTSEINNFKNYLNNLSDNKPIYIKKSRINILDKDNLLLTIGIDKLDLSNKGLFTKANLKGQIFNTKVKINYQLKNTEKKPTSNITLSIPKIGLSIKSSINVDEKNKKILNGRTNISFPNNKFYLDYVYKENSISILNSNLTNNYFKGQMFGDLNLHPFLIFNINSDVGLLKFNNILKSDFVKNKLLAAFIPFNQKINGKLNINIKEIKSSSNIINSGKVNLEFRNGIMIINAINLEVNKMGKIKLVGKILQQKKKKLFFFDTNIVIENYKIFYSRFLIPKRKRVNFRPINLLGKIDLETLEISLDKVYIENEPSKIELEPNELLMLKDKINQIVSQNTLDNVLRYSNFRNIIQSFF